MVIHENTWAWGRCWTIIREDGLASIKLLLRNDDPERVSAWLTDLIVHESARRKGYGKQIFEHVFQKARELDIKNLYLYVDADEWVREWYERNGFLFCDYDKNGLAVMMKKM